LRFGLLNEYTAVDEIDSDVCAVIVTIRAKKVERGRKGVGRPGSARFARRSSDVRAGLGLRRKDSCAGQYTASINTEEVVRAMKKKNDPNDKTCLDELKREGDAGAGEGWEKSTVDEYSETNVLLASELGSRG
jgi:hypothetical protein